MSAPHHDQLVRRAVGGDREALDLLWTDARRWVAVVLLAGGARPGDLADLLQETACDLTRGIATLRETSAFRPWLRSLALNALRSARRRRHDLPLEEEVVAAAGPGEGDAGAVWAALHELPADYREPLLLKSVEGMSQRAIAEALGVPETTIESRLVRARRFLRASLARRDVVPDACRHEDRHSALPVGCDGNHSAERGRSRSPSSAPRGNEP